MLNNPLHASVLCYIMHLQMKINLDIAVDLQGRRLLSPPLPPHVLRIYFNKNFVPREYFNGLLDFRKPTIKLGTSRAKTQIVSSEGK